MKSLTVILRLCRITATCGMPRGIRLPACVSTVLLTFLMGASPSFSAVTTYFNEFFGGSGEGSYLEGLATVQLLETMFAGAEPQLAQISRRSTALKGALQKMRATRDEKAAASLAAVKKAFEESGSQTLAEFIKAYIQKHHR